MSEVVLHSNYSVYNEYFKNSSLKVDYSDQNHHDGRLAHSTRHPVSVFSECPSGQSVHRLFLRVLYGRWVVNGTQSLLFVHHHRRGRRLCIQVGNQLLFSSRIFFLFIVRVNDLPFHLHLGAQTSTQPLGINPKFSQPFFS